MNRLFISTLFCIILMSSSVSAKSVSVSWEGYISLFYQEDYFSKIQTKDINEAAKKLVDNDLMDVIIDKEYIIRHGGNEMDNKKMNASVVVVMYLI